MHTSRHFPVSVVGSLLLAVASARAVEIIAVWSGPPLGNYNVAANWLPVGTPTNGADVYIVQIGAPADVSINGNFSIQSLDLDAGTFATIAPGFTFTLNADSLIDGTLTIGADGNTNPSRLGIGTSLALTGVGKSVPWFGEFLQHERSAAYDWCGNHARHPQRHGQHRRVLESAGDHEQRRRVDLR